MLHRAYSKLLLTSAVLRVPESGAFVTLSQWRITSTSTSQAWRRHVVVDVEYNDDDNKDSLTTNMDDKIIHLDHAGASPSPTCVLDTVIEHLKLEQRIGGYAAASKRQDDLAQVYEDVACLIHASSPEEVALVESATVAWTRLFYSMVEYQDTSFDARNRKVILISEAEYAANVVAACQWARTHDHWTVLPIPSSTNSDGRSTGIVDVQVFKDMLDGSHERLDPADIALVCVTHIPTNSGIVNPVQEMGTLIEEFNNNKGPTDDTRVLFLVDACQSVGQLDVNVQDIKCHGLTATGRKYLRGPRGTGFLYVREEFVDSLVPSHLDHACAPVTQVPPTYPPSSNVQDWIDITLQPGAKRFEFWESNIGNTLSSCESSRVCLLQLTIPLLQCNT